MVHGGVSYQEDLEQTVTWTAMCGGSRGVGDATIGAQQEEWAGSTVMVTGEDNSEERGEKGLALAQASLNSTPPVER